MSITSLSGVKLSKGTVIDINQTVNGYSKFVVTNLDPITVHYVSDGFQIVREYEYSVRELLQLDDYCPYDEPITVIGHMDL